MLKWFCVCPEWRNAQPGVFVITQLNNHSCNLLYTVQSFNHSNTHAFILECMDASPNYAYGCMRALNRALTCTHTLYSLARTLTHPPTHPPTHSFACSFVRSSDHILFAFADASKTTTQAPPPGRLSDIKIKIHTSSSCQNSQN